MSTEKIKVRQWPFDATMDFINGSGFDSSTIKRLNEHGTEDQKRNFIHERRKDTLYGGVALTGLVGSMLAYDAVKNNGHLFNNVNPAPIEQYGGHQPGVDSTN
jgi:hypothetical protein